MRAFWMLLVGPLALLAQPPLVRGVLVERGTAAEGEFSLRTAEDKVFRFQYDSRTYVESEERLSQIARLQPGEKVEVVSEQVPEYRLRYARTVHVIPPQPPPRPLTMGRYRAWRPSDERALPTGNLTFSGLVFRLNDGRLVLHLRDGGEQTIRLIKETRYLANGEVVEASELKTNMRVFVRAGKDMYGQVEAYQVVWGKILEPQ